MLFYNKNIIQEQIEAKDGTGPHGTGRKNARSKEECRGNK